MAVSVRAVWVPLVLSAAAELVGVASAALDLAVEYIKVRQQFGRPLRSFQVVQHRAANDAIAVAEASVIVHQTASFSGDAAHSRHLACVALSKAVDTATISLAKSSRREPDAA
jgi:alkylation response protein AidB-like acyl-CoA dehydrogenase